MIYRPREETKSYEEIIEEALESIPLLSEEWTNYNVSDPGVTILQNFAAFHVLQQQSLREITEAARRKLLKLVGFEAGINRPGRVMLAPEAGTGPFCLPKHQRLYAGETCFETIRQERADPGALIGVWLEEGGRRREVTYLLNSRAAAAVPVFGSEAEEGKNPLPGNGLWLVFDRLPGPGETVILYVDVEEGKRNPFDPEHVPGFAKISWQCYTETGWEPLAVSEEPLYFLASGRLVFTVPERGAKRFREEEIDGYVVRCRLLVGHYDLSPMVRAIYDCVIEVEQRKTAAALFRLRGSRVTVLSAVAAGGAFEVFVREEPGENYRRYMQCAAARKGRFYRAKSGAAGELMLEFDRETFGYGPYDGEEAVMVVCWSQDMISHRFLGTVFGYDDQIIEMEEVEHVIPEGFCVLAKMRDDKGEEYQFVVPGSRAEEELGYELLSREGSLRIYNPGYSRECSLYLASCAVTKKGSGGLRPGSSLTAAGISFISVSPEFGRTCCESVEELEKRFTEDLTHPQTAVSARDYEVLVSETPGLCIDKVKAWMDARGNRVKIAVKPESRQPFPGLSEIYGKAVRDYLEPRRMITTEITIVEPEYVPICVSGRIRGKKRFGGCEETVRTFLRERFEELAAEAGFGGEIPFSRIFREVEELDCVAEICDLQARPQSGAAWVRGGEIVLEPHCLGYLAEEVKLEIIF